MRWRLILEEYIMELIHSKGSKNVVSDALSRLDKIDNLNAIKYPTLESLSENFALIIDISDSN